MNARHYGKFLAACATITLGGCATVGTQPFVSESGEGQSYHLPRAQMELRISESDGVVAVVLSGPTMVADASAHVISRLPRSGIADTNVTITVDPKTNLLARVEAVSTGRIADIVAAAVRSVSFLQSGRDSVARQLFYAEFAPHEAAAVAAAANQALAQYQYRTCTGLSARQEDDSADQAARRGICAGLAQSGLTARTAAGFVALEFSEHDGDPVQPAVAVASETIGACGRGICYRPLRPIRLRMQVGQVYQEQRTILVPNEAQLAFVPLPSGGFAQQKYTLTFTNGVLTTYQQDSRSELVGLATLPGAIVGGLISGPAEAIGLRQNALTAETNYLNALRTNAEAQAQARAACGEAQTAACAPHGYNVIRVDLGSASQGAGSSGGGVQSDDGPPGDSGR